MTSARKRAISGTSIAGVVLLVVVLVVGAAYLFANPPASGATASSGQYTFTNYGQVTSPSTASTSAAPTSPTITDVYIPNDNGYPFAPFQPQVVTVVIGVNNTVEWINQDVLVHDVISNGGFFASGDLTPLTGTYQFTFTQAGTYPYYCSYHPSHTGVVVVLNAAS